MTCALDNDLLTCQAVSTFAEYPTECALQDLLRRTTLQVGVDSLAVMHLAVVKLQQMYPSTGDSRCTLMSSGSAVPVSETAAEEHMQSDVLVCDEVQIAYKLPQL